MESKQTLEITIDGKLIYSAPKDIITDPADCMACPGVYLLRNPTTDQVEYIGTSHNVRARFYGNGESHHAYNPDRHILEVIYTQDDYTRVWLEAVLVSTLLPPENRKIGVRLGECGGHLTEQSSGYTKDEELEQSSLFPLAV